jgi:hypothetical protein
MGRLRIAISKNVVFRAPFLTGGSAALSAAADRAAKPLSVAAALVQVYPCSSMFFGGELHD